jgi:hypothetical protein
MQAKKENTHTQSRTKLQARSKTRTEALPSQNRRKTPGKITAGMKVTAPNKSSAP